MQDTRAATANPDVHLQRELEQKKKENLKHEITIAAMRARLDAFEEKQPAIRQITREMGILAGEIQQLKTVSWSSWKWESNGRRLRDCQQDSADKRRSSCV
jgi:predicted  nucleic acid-binding Zn-ribbon protein